MITDDNCYKDQEFNNFCAYLPDYDFDDRQMQFFRDAFELVMYNHDTQKVSCLAGRCGIGKSTFIKALIHYCMSTDLYGNKKEPVGLVVITDSIRRIEDMVDVNADRRSAEEAWDTCFKLFGLDKHYKAFRQNVAVLRSGDIPFIDQLLRQNNKPILLLSTQRYFMLNEQIRERLFSFKYGDETRERNRILFDECPYFSESVTIDSTNLTRIESALYEGLSDEVQDKDFVIQQFKEFKDSLLNSMDAKEKMLETENVIVYWKNKYSKTITINDELFFNVIMENLGSLMKQYPSILKDLLCLRDLAAHGAIFNSVKKRLGNYKRSFEMVRDNRECFYLGGNRKFFVFDATADIDPRYDLDYVEVIGGEKYNKPLKMKVTNVKISTSKNALCRNGQNSKDNMNAIIQYLKDAMTDSHENILIVAYSDIVQQFKKVFPNVAYFGNLKGFNDYKDFSNMAHVGMNRFPNMTYFYIYCGCHMEAYTQFENMKEDVSLGFLDAICKNDNPEYREAITDIMLRSILADFEQNIFRLAIRNYDNKIPVHIWTFYNYSDPFFKKLAAMIEKRYKPYGAKFEYMDTPEALKLARVKNRKTKNGEGMNNVQKIIEWYEKQPSGKEFKVKELLDSIGLTDKQFQKAKKNQEIKRILNNSQTDRKGYYVIK